MSDGPTLDADAAWGQLLLLRDSTSMTGILHEAQVLQLKLWIQLAVPHAVRAKMSFDATDEKSRFIRYDVEVKGAAPSNLSDLLAGLDRSIKTLLGPDWEVSVYGRRVKVLGGLKSEKLLFRGPRRALRSMAHRNWQQVVGGVHEENGDGER